MVNFIRLVRGEHIEHTKLRFQPGEILFSRIYPDRGRVFLARETFEDWFIPGTERDVYAAVTSTEIYIVRPREEEEWDRYILFSALRSQFVMDQVRDRITGTSTSRPRISIDDLRQVLVPLLPREQTEALRAQIREGVREHWDACRQFLATHQRAMQIYGDQVNIAAMDMI